jgi:hypothetical protein
MNVKETLLLWFSKLSKATTLPRKNIPFTEAKNIGILFHADEETHIRVIVELVKVLEAEQKKVKILAYTSQILSIGNKLTLSEFTKKDITSSGKIKSEVVKDFIKEPFDYLFCIYNQTFIPFDKIMADSHAYCRVGRFEEDKTRFYELMVVHLDEQPLQSLSEQMIFFVKKCSFES